MESHLQYKNKGNKVKQNTKIHFYRNKYGGDNIEGSQIGTGEKESGNITVTRTNKKIQTRIQNNKQKVEKKRTSNTIYSPSS